MLRARRQIAIRAAQGGGGRSDRPRTLLRLPTCRLRNNPKRQTDMRLLSMIALALAVLVSPAAAQAPAADPANTLVLELTTGKVLIKLRPDLAPGHVARVKELAKEGFYNGIVFHRVIEGFMAQTGDPTGTGTGGSKKGNLKAEFTPTAFERGTIGAARSASPDSADSQFFICFTHTPFLNGKYTVWGQVIDGMGNVDKVARGEPPAKPDKIVKAYILADAK
jgi:peptidylprolyl isomerase